jgi:hypothetical protein
MKKQNKITKNPSMIFFKNGIEKKPLSIFNINGKYIVGVYQGSISKFDILIKYRQKEIDNYLIKWSRLRTPKHIHWTVDLLIKMNYDKKKTSEFIDFLIALWNNTKSDETEEMRMKNLKEDVLLKTIDDEANSYLELNNYGEYSIKFLILLARLLMKQEKNNRNDAYMFKKLLDSLKNYKSIYQIISTATMNGR